ncbi:MAG: hypothetical protein RIF32_17440 [Leptospirales bacterium]
MAAFVLCIPSAPPKVARLVGALALCSVWLATCAAPDATVAAPDEPRPVTLVVPGHSTSPSKGMGTERPVDGSDNGGPYAVFQNETLREDLARYLSTADRELKTNLPDGWSTKYEFFRGRLPFQWNGEAGVGLRVDLVSGDGAPRLTRYLYYQLNAGFSRPVTARIRPDRIYGITRDFVVIMPSSSTPESAYENRAVRPVFDRAFQVSDANTIRYAVRLPALPADDRDLSRKYPEQKAAIAGDPANQTTYALWVRTLR